VAPLLGGGDGGTLRVAENAGPAEVAAAAVHVGLPCATRAVEAVQVAWCVRVTQVVRGAWAGSAGGQRRTRFVGPSRGWCHADRGGGLGEDCQGGAGGAVGAALVAAAETEEAAGAERFVEATLAARGAHVAGGRQQEPRQCKLPAEF
jgi:hypothetical protein